MISIEKARKELGKVAEGMSDKRVKEVRDSIYKFVEIAFDNYFDSLNKK